MIILNPNIDQETDNIDKEVEFTVPRYVKDRRLFDNGFVAVHLVQRKDGTKAARKHLHQLFQEEMVDDDSNLVKFEIDLLKSVSGKPHMPTFLGSVQANDIQYMYYQPWRVCSLKSWLANPDKLKNGQNNHPWELCAQWMICLTSALHNLHVSEPPIIHGDLKPANIILTHDFNIIIIDFGVGNLYKNKIIASRYKGTLQYMAPELINGDSYHRTADVFSLGCIFAELFTIMSGFRSGHLFGFLKNKAYFQCTHWAINFVVALKNNLFSNSDAAATYVEVISKMLDMIPLDRPTFAEVHDKLRTLGNYNCCKDKLLYEDNNPSHTQSLPKPFTEGDAEVYLGYKRNNK